MFIQKKKLMREIFTDENSIVFYDNIYNTNLIDDWDDFFITQNTYPRKLSTFLRYIPTFTERIIIIYETSKYSNAIAYHPFHYQPTF